MDKSKFLSCPELPDSVFLAKGAVVLGDLRCGESVSFWFNVVVRADNNYVQIGQETNIQDSTVIHLDDKPCIIGNRVTIGHRAIVHGAILEDECMIGMGAVVLNNAVIKKGAIVGAGAVVTQGMVVEENTMVLGTPAKVKKVDLNFQERNRLVAAHYVEQAKLYKGAGYNQF